MAAARFAPPRSSPRPTDRTNKRTPARANVELYAVWDGAVTFAAACRLSAIRCSGRGESFPFRQLCLPRVLLLPSSDSRLNAQEIASILLFRGALSFPQLAKLTALPPSLVHASLLVLSTHCLLFHSETEVGGRLTELYELNHDAIERRLRGGMYVEMATEWQGGPQLGQVVEGLWKEGMLRREDLIEVVRCQLAAERGVDAFGGEAADGDDPKGKKRAKEADKGASFLWAFSSTASETDPCKSRSAVAEDAERLVRKAFAQGYIQIVTPGSQLSPSSLEIKWEEELRALIKGAFLVASSPEPRS